MMFYSLFAYAGLTLVILSGARVLDPFFESIGDSGEMVQLAVEVACFVIGAELLLKPAFEDQKEIGTKKNITRIRKKTLKRRQRIIISSKEVTVRGIKSIVKNKRNI